MNDETKNQAQAFKQGAKTGVRSLGTKESRTQYLRAQLQNENIQFRYWCKLFYSGKVK